MHHACCAVHAAITASYGLPMHAYACHIMPAASCLSLPTHATHLFVPTFSMPRPLTAVRTCCLVVCALQHAEVLGARHVVVKGDSQLAVNQMKGIYR